MGRVLELPEMNVQAWQTFSEILGEIHAVSWSQKQIDAALSDVRPIFMEVWQSSKFEATVVGGDDLIRQINIGVSQVVVPLLAELVRLQLELRACEACKKVCK